MRNVSVIGRIRGYGGGTVIIGGSGRANAAFNATALSHVIVDVVVEVRHDYAVAVHTRTAGRERLMLSTSAISCI